jgi:alkylhydroperoxidase family enzyme
MSRIPIPADIASAPAKSQAMLEAVKAKFGIAPNVFRLVATSPAALEGYTSVLGALARGTVSAATGERIALAVAEINGCSYCLSTPRPTPQCVSPPRSLTTAATSAKTICGP